MSARIPVRFSCVRDFILKSANASFFSVRWNPHHHQWFLGPSQQIHTITSFLQHASSSSVKPFEFKARIIFILKPAVQRQKFRRPCRQRRCKYNDKQWKMMRILFWEETCQIPMIHKEHPKNKSCKITRKNQIQKEWKLDLGIIFENCSISPAQLWLAKQSSCSFLVALRTTTLHLEYNTPCESWR
jgi:hypothetical protein